MPEGDPYLQAVQIFCDTCQAEFKDDIRSVMIMGSVARNEHIIGKSDIDMVCVLRKDSTDLQRIASIRESFSEIMKGKGIPHPYLEVLRPSEYAKAHLYLDLFSLHDLKTNGKVVYGKDLGKECGFPPRRELREVAQLHISGIRRSAYELALSRPDLGSAPEILEALMVYVAFAAGVVLLSRGVMVSLKREILERFGGSLPELAMMFDTIMKEALEGPPKEPKEREALAKMCLTFLDSLCEESNITVS